MTVYKNSIYKRYIASVARYNDVEPTGATTFNVCDIAIDSREIIA